METPDCHREPQVETIRIDERGVISGNSPDDFRTHAPTRITTPVRIPFLFDDPEDVEPGSRRRKHLPPSPTPP